MMAYQFLLVLVILGMSSAIPQRQVDTTEVTSSEEIESYLSTTNIPTDNNAIQKIETPLEARKKKGGMEHMYMMFMMCKSVITTMVSLLQPVFQVKSLTISFIGMLINLGRFLMQLKESKNGGGGGVGTGYSSVSYVGAGTSYGEDRIGSALPPHIKPNYITKYSYTE